MSSRDQGAGEFQESEFKTEENAASAWSDKKSGSSRLTITTPFYPKKKATSPGESSAFEPSAAPIQQAGFDESPERGSSDIELISAKDGNAFGQSASEEEINFPSFPAFGANEEFEEEDLEELEEENEAKAFQFEPEEAAPSVEPPTFNLGPQSEQPKAQPEVPLFKTELKPTARFAPAPWSDLTIKGPITPSVATRWVNNGVLNVGQQAECELQVRNIASTPVHNLLLDAVLPAHVEVVSVEPAIEITEGQLTWEIDHLKEDEELSFKIVFIPHERGPLMAEAHVRFSAMTAAAFHVEEPMLKLALEGPKKVMVGEAATQVITVANPGTGVAQNVVIHAELPEGLEHAQGKKVALPVGSLNPSEKRRIRLPLVCVAGGTQELEISAVAESGLTEVVTTSVDVVAPELALLAEGPRLRFVGRTATYRLTVNNIGSAESSNVRLLHKVPAGFDFVQADKGGKFNDSSRVVQWFVGRLEPGQTAVVQVQLEATELGSTEQKFAAVSDQATRTEAAVQTIVDGTPSLALEILDLDDPVEVGRETAYEIRVRNIGSKEAQQVDVKCELPEGVLFQTARGPSAHKQTGGTIQFKPLAILPAGETAIFRVHVVGEQAGKQNISVELKSRDDEEPLVYQEQTRFYQD
ncbi:MAG: hypothetical protein R3C11_07785 [Planctomycetaceae bacterium]